MEKTQYYKTTLDVNVKAIASSLEELKDVLPVVNESKASPMMHSEEIPEDLFQDLRGVLKKDPDLLYGLSIFASEGVNKNKDTFLREILTRIFKTPRHKFVDYEHDADGLNARGDNPEEYQIVGHIYDSQLATQENHEYIPDQEVKRDDIDGEWFEKDSKWRGKALDIVVAWVLYKFQFPELAEMVDIMTDLDPDRFGVSMEVLFTDYKFRIGGTVDAEEHYSFDGNSTGAREIYKGDPLAEMFQASWNEGKHRVWEGQPVVRILGGDIFFSGMAVTTNRANARSWNISIGSKIEELLSQAAESESSDKLVELIKTVAAKSSAFDFDTCEIIDGKPSCDCIDQAIAGSVDNIVEEIEKFKQQLEKARIVITEVKRDPKDLYRHEGVSDFLFGDPFLDMDDFIMRTNDVENGVIRAQKKLRNLFENNLDNNLSGQEVLEFVEEIETIIRRSRVDAAVAIEKREEVNPKSGEKKYGDVKFADEKNNKYPIDTVDHIRAAWTYINQSKNAAKYSSEDVSKIKSRIISAWKDKIDPEGPPSVAEGSDDLDSRVGEIEQAISQLEGEIKRLDDETIKPRPFDLNRIAITERKLGMRDVE